MGDERLSRREAVDLVAVLLELLADVAGCPVEDLPDDFDDEDARFVRLALSVTKDRR